MKKFDDRKKERFWLTPPKLYSDLNKEFHFDTDPCPHPRPPGYDGLKAPWGRSNFVNPPFGGHPILWARRCIEEGEKGNTVVYIKPLWDEIYELVVASAEIRPLGRISFLSMETGKPNPRRSWNVAAFIFRKEGGTTGGIV